jgi:ribonuclease HI
MNNITNQFLKGMKRYIATSCIAKEKPFELYIHSINRTNPGITSSAAVLYDNNGDIVDTKSQCNGMVSNDVSNYESILSGLELCKKENVKDLIINTESHLLVKQLSGLWKVKGFELRMLNLRCNRVLSKFDEWDIRHINKEDNLKARELSTKVLKSLEQRYKIPF